MPAITVKNIPDSLYSRLKQSAKMHHRSINSELIVCLEKASIPQKISGDKLLANARGIRARFGGFKVSNEDLNRAISAGRKRLLPIQIQSPASICHQTIVMM